MNEDPVAAIAPPAEPAAPPEPATPASAPEPPGAPVTPSGDDGKPTEAEQKEIDEWDKATDEMFPGLHKAEEDDKNESAKSSEGTPSATPPEKQPEGDGTSKPPDEGGAEKTEPESTENEPPEPTEAISRRSAREQTEAIDSIKADVREKMFGQVATELRDRDGDPIRSIGDVMRLVNPNTGEAFTPEEAAVYLREAQAALRDNVAEVNQQVEQIAEVNLDLKDQADIINYQYGELLQAMPELQKQLWGQYEKTLVKDSKSGVITKAPISLQDFYSAALEPYAQLGRQLEQQEVSTAATDAKVAADAEAAKAKAEESRQQRRADRSDIYGGGKVDTRDDEQKEWDAAAEAVFGDQLKGLRR